jgi:hypothetical protein
MASDFNRLSDSPDLSGVPGAAGDAKQFLDALVGVVKATSSLIQSVSDLLPNETRSIVIEINNETSHPLIKTADNFAHGGFGPTLPKQRIPPFANDVFSVESSGIATGISGSCTYNAEGVGDFLVGFDNPFVGSNAVNANASPTVQAQISIIGEKSDGNHNHARFSIIENGPPTPGAQGEWRACKKCSGMFFSGFPEKGACPGGGVSTIRPTASVIQ